MREIPRQASRASDLIMNGYGATPSFNRSGESTSAVLGYLTSKKSKVLVSSHLSCNRTNVALSERGNAGISNRPRLSDIQSEDGKSSGTTADNPHFFAMPFTFPTSRASQFGPERGKEKYPSWKRENLTGENRGPMTKTRYFRLSSERIVGSVRKSRCERMRTFVRSVKTIRTEDDGYQVFRFRLKTDSRKHIRKPLMPKPKTVEVFSKRV